MTVQITIIGLGQIGTSIGLGLKAQTDSIRRVGHDRDPGYARQAKNMGALDKVSLNLYRAIDGADLVVLALPLDQVRETIQLIAEDLKEGAVLIDTAPVKRPVAAWAAEWLPPGRHYVGMTPIINAAYLHGMERGPEAAQEDLFNGGFMAIVPERNADSAAVKLAVDLTALVGATPLFVDAIEVDSFMAATHLLPQLMAAALLNVTVDTPGWTDSRKFAGKAFAQSTAAAGALDTAAALAEACMQNDENTLRMVDQLVQGLQAVRKTVAEGDGKTLEEHLERLAEARKQWWDVRRTGEWDDRERSELPAQTAGQALGQVFFGGLFRKRPKND